VPDLVAAGQEAGTDTALGTLEAVGEYGGLVGVTGAGAVFEPADAVVVDAESLEVLALVLAHHGEAVGDGAAGQVVVEPVHMPADVGDAGVQSVGLGDVTAAFLVEGERHRVGEQRLGGPQVDFEPGRHAELGDSLLALFRGRGNGRTVFVGRII